MARQRDWNALSDSTQHRYERAGVGREAYESGVNLAGARGHGATPEKPGTGQDNPRFREYYDLRKEINELKKEIFGHNVGKASQREMSKKGRAALLKARDRLQDMHSGNYDWESMIAQYPELAADEWDWLRHYH